TQTAGQRVTAIQSAPPKARPWQPCCLHFASFVSSSVVRLPQKTGCARRSSAVSASGRSAGKPWPAELSFGLAALRSRLRNGRRLHAFSMREAASCASLFVRQKAESVCLQTRAKDKRSRPRRKNFFGGRRDLTTEEETMNRTDTQEPRKASLDALAAKLRNG